MIPVILNGSENNLPLSLEHFLVTESVIHVLTEPPPNLSNPRILNVFHLRIYGDFIWHISIELPPLHSLAIICSLFELRDRSSRIPVVCRYFSWSTVGSSLVARGKTVFSGRSQSG